MSHGFDELSSLVSSVVTSCKELATPIPPTPPSSQKIVVSDVCIENLPLDDLYKWLAQHREHLEFLTKCGMCDADKKADIVARCELVFDIINSRTASASQTGVSLN
mgnify:CR=1 FL=1